MEDRAKRININTKRCSNENKAVDERELITREVIEEKFFTLKKDLILHIEKVCQIPGVRKRSKVNIFCQMLCQTCLPNMLCQIPYCVISQMDRLATIKKKTVIEFSKEKVERCFTYNS